MTISWILVVGLLILTIEEVVFEMKATAGDAHISREDDEITRQPTASVSSISMITYPLLIIGSKFLQ